MKKRGRKPRNISDESRKIYFAGGDTELDPDTHSYRMKTGENDLSASGISDSFSFPPAPAGDDARAVKKHVKNRLMCDSCFGSNAGCPDYKEGSECAYNFSSLIDMFNSDGKKALSEAAIKLLDIQFERIMRASHFERLSGGIIDQTLSGEISNFFEFLKTAKVLSINLEGSVVNKSSLISSMLQSKKSK